MTGTEKVQRPDGLPRWARWSRSDQIGLEGLLYGAAGLAALSVVPGVVTAVRGGPVPLTTPLPEQLVALPDGVEGPVTGAVVLDDLSWGEHVLALLPSLVAVGLFLAGVGLLLGVVRCLREGDPFTRGSARRLSWLALLVAVGGTGVQLLEDFARNNLLSGAAALAGEELGSSWTLALWPLLVGLLVAFVAEVLARGSALREDVEGLV